MLDDLIDEPAHLAEERRLADAQLIAGSSDHGPTSEPSSWQPRDLSALADPDAARTVPTILTASDTLALLYPGKIHSFSGETESGKTWLALHAAAQQILAGHHVAIIDFEDDAASIVGRLTALGVPFPNILAACHYVQPAEPITDKRDRITPGHLDIVATVTNHDPTLVVIDGVTEAMSLEGLSIESNGDVAVWYRALPRLLADLGPAVVMIDHVTKSAETRGRWAIGGQHKLAGITGAAYVIDNAVPFRPGGEGRSKVTIAKDRPGAVRAAAEGRKHVADLVMTPTTDDGIELRLIATVPSTNPDGAWRPTVLMGRCWRFVRDHQGDDAPSGRAIREGVKGSNNTIPTALDRLVEEEHLTVTTEGQAKRYHLGPKPWQDE